MIVRPDQAHVYTMGRGEARILVDAERSGGTWWLGQFREDPGYTTGLHFHHQTDEQFFAQHPDRRARIRHPDGPKLERDTQRAVRYLSECELEFRSLGPHDKARRRIIAWRTEADHPTHPMTIIKVPFLAFADETIEDRDDVLLPILDGIMKEATR